jgi:hypothetical protein
MDWTLIDEEYRAGYIAGFRSARKDDVAEPDVPATPFIQEGQTARYVGWHHDVCTVSMQRFRVTPKRPTDKEKAALTT